MTENVPVQELKLHSLPDVLYCFLVVVVYIPTNDVMFHQNNKTK